MAANKAKSGERGALTLASQVPSAYPVMCGIHREAEKTVLVKVRASVLYSGTIIILVIKLYYRRKVFLSLLTQVRGHVAVYLRITYIYVYLKFLQKYVIFMTYFGYYL